VDQSLSSEVDSSSAGQEFPHRLRNSKFHRYVHKIPPLDPIVIFRNPLHSPTLWFLYRQFNIVLLCTPKSPNQSSSPMRATYPARLITLIIFGEDLG